MSSNKEKEPSEFPKPIQIRLIPTTAENLRELQKKLGTKNRTATIDRAVDVLNRLIKKEGDTYYIEIKLPGEEAIRIMVL